jgi:hypothetical protein
MELKIIMLSEMKYTQKAKYTCFPSFVEPRPKVKITTDDECKTGTPLEGVIKSGKEKKEGNRGKEDESMMSYMYMCIYEDIA